ncbi:MAG TPA: hypothetical protein VML96_01060 [Egibacteraceae bacterium]|nr:hypothetical protein [Egibacteraceae bacterium]
MLAIALGLVSGLIGMTGVMWALGGIVHRIHDLAPSLTLALLVAPAAFGLLGSRRLSIVAMQQTAAVAAAWILAGFLSGRVDGFAAVLAVIVAALAALHPHRRLLWIARPRWPQAVIVAAAAPFVAAYAVREGRFQQIVAPTDPHAADGHYLAMAVTALAILAVATVAALSAESWRLPTWCAALTSISLGIASVEAPRLQGSLGRVGGAAAIVGAMAFGLAAELHGAKANRGSGSPQPRGGIEGPPAIV